MLVPAGVAPHVRASFGAPRAGNESMGREPFHYGRPVAGRQAGTGYEQENCKLERRADKPEALAKN
jgi:hypothetical protein